jgi:hypothetical protein
MLRISTILDAASFGVIGCALLVGVACCGRSAPAASTEPATAPSEGAPVSVKVFVESKVWDPGRHPDFPIVLFFGCEKGSPYEGRKLDLWTELFSVGEDWSRAGEVLGRAAAGAAAPARDRQAAEGIPQDLVVLFFDDVDASGRHLPFPGENRNGGGLLPNSDPQVPLDCKGSLWQSEVDWDETRNASKIKLRAFLVLDGKICARSSEVVVDVRSTDVDRYRQFAGDAWAAAGNAGCFGPPLVEGRLAIEEIVSDAALRGGLLKQIDAFDAEASGAFRAAARDPSGLMCHEMLQLWDDGGRLQQALTAGIPVAQQESVAKRVSTLESQLTVLRCLGGGDGRALVDALSLRLHLTDAQRARAVALIAPLEEAQQTASTKPVSAPVTTPLEDAGTLMATYRSFRALLTPAQQATYDRTN